MDPTTPRGGRTRRRPAAILVAAWGLVLVAAAVWSAATGPATVREQSDLAHGRRVLDEAVAAVVAAAGPAAGQVGDYQVTTGCQLSLVRQGTAVEQAVVFTVPEGQEAALLQKLADRLPPEWEPRIRRGSGDLYADAGDFVRVDGEVTGVGQVRVTGSTGCRPGDDPGLAGAGGADQ